MESLIIGFGGEAGHGKSTCANIAEQWFLENGYSVKVISFADKLKEVCKIMFRLSEKDLNTQIGKSTYRNHIRTTPREIMQKFGTEVCREGIIRHLPTFSEGGRTIWTWNVERDILECAADVILIPDVRFPDELQMLRNFGCIFINVIREVEVSTDEKQKHSSETGLPDADYLIMNDGLMTDLEEKIKALLIKNTYQEEADQTFSQP
jgi:hypothetical protein